MAYTYILECADNTLYVGWTVDLVDRLNSHNSGTGSRYTRGRLPVKLVYAEYQPDRSRGQKREAELKRLSRQEKLKLISKAKESGGVSVWTEQIATI